MKQLFLPHSFNKLSRFFHPNNLHHNNYKRYISENFSSNPVRRPFVFPLNNSKWFGKTAAIELQLPKANDKCDEMKSTKFNVLIPNRTLFPPHSPTKKEKNHLPTAVVQRLQLPQSAPHCLISGNRPCPPHSSTTTTTPPTSLSPLVVQVTSPSQNSGEVRAIDRPAAK